MLRIKPKDKNFNEVLTQTISKTRKVKDMALTSFKISVNTFQIIVKEENNSLESKMISFSGHDNREEIKNNSYPINSFFQKNKSSDTTIFKVVQDMPRFPGCENIEELSKEELKDCSDQKLLAYLYTNLKYPQQARDQKIEGRVYVQFVVEKDGSVSQINLARGIGGGCNEAVLDLVESMNEMEVKWRPGYQRGKPVRVMYTLPVAFKLEDDNMDSDKFWFDWYRKASAEGGVDGRKALFFIDGVKQKNIEKLREIVPEDVFCLAAVKSEQAVLKYGVEGQYGVVEVFTHSGKNDIPRSSDCYTKFKREQLLQPVMDKVDKAISDYNKQITNRDKGTPFFGTFIDGEEVDTLEVFDPKTNEKSLYVQDPKRFKELRQKDVMPSDQKRLRNLENLEVFVSDDHSMAVYFVSKSELPFDINIYDLNGRKIGSKKVQNYEGQGLAFVTTFANLNLTSGIYVITAKQGEEIVSKKISYFRK